VQAVAVSRRGFSGDAPENAVELRQRLEADFVGGFADALVRIEQEIFHLLDADAREIIREREAGGLLEHLAEIEGAHVHLLRHILEGDFLGVLIGDEGAGAGDRGIFGVVFLNRELVAQRGEVLREDGEQTQDRFVLFLETTRVWKNASSSFLRSTSVPHLRILRVVAAKVFVLGLWSKI
jgi:hypothetical protein